MLDSRSCNFEFEREILFSRAALYDDSNWRGNGEKVRAIASQKEREGGNVTFARARHFAPRESPRCVQADSRIFGKFLSSTSFNGIKKPFYANRKQRESF